MDPQGSGRVGHFSRAAPGHFSRAVKSQAGCVDQGPDSALTTGARGTESYAVVLDNRKAAPMPATQRELLTPRAEHRAQLAGAYAPPLAPRP